MIIVMVSSCSWKHSHKGGMSQFRAISSEKVMGNAARGIITPGLKVIINQTKIEDKARLYLSDIVDTICGIKLETTETSVIGTIDKIRIKNALIYVLDRYKTHLLKVFNIKGTYISTIGRNGNGPGEYVEPTDFYVDNKKIIIYDQFQSKLLYFNLEGRFLYERSLPFTFLQFYQFSQNQYLMCGLDADNYHLSNLLNYSIWNCDSVFQVNHFGMYRKKDAYINILPKNLLNEFCGKLYYHESCRDTIYSVDSAFNVRFDYVIDFGKYTPPKSLFLIENKKEYIHNNQYAFGEDFAITPHYLYYNFSYKRTLYHLFYRLHDSKIYYGNNVVNDVNYIFPFENILSANGDTLIGYSQVMPVHDFYQRVPQDEWLKMQNHHGQILLNEGKDVRNFCKDLKDDDNPIILLYRLKEGNANEI